MATHDITDDRRDELDAMLDEYTNDELERHEDPNGDYFNDILACCAADTWTYEEAADRIQRWYGNPDITSDDIDDLYEQIMDAATLSKCYTMAPHQNSQESIEVMGFPVQEVEIHIPAEQISDDPAEVRDLIERHNLSHDGDNVIVYAPSDVVLTVVLSRDALTEIINNR